MTTKKGTLTTPKRRTAVTREPPPESRGASLGSIASFADILGAGGQSISDYLHLPEDRLGKYADYEAMGAYPLISQALNVIANEACQPSSEHDGHVAWVVSPEDSVQTALNAVLHNVVKVDRLSWARIRRLAQYGDHFIEPVLGPDGLADVVDLPPETMHRIEVPRRGVYGWVQSFNREQRVWTPKSYDALTAEYEKAREQDGPNSVRAIPFAPHQVVHLRLLGESLGGLYGDSVLSGARWIWRRLLLMDDAALIYRLHRAPERLVYYLSVGNKSDEEARAVVRKFREQVRKRKFIDSSGKQRMRYDPVGVDEDIFIPMRVGDESRVESLSSPAFQAMDDVEAFRTLLFGGLGVPRAYLGDETGVVRATLSAQDVNFARSELRIQQEYRLGLVDLTDLHIAQCGLEPSEVQYDIHMAAPSAIFELAEMEVRNAKAQLAAMLGEFFPKEWILRRVFGLPDAEVQALLSSKKDETADAMAMAAEMGAPMPEAMRARFQRPANTPMPAAVSAKLDRVLSENKGFREYVQKVTPLMRDLTRLLAAARSPVRTASRKAP